MCYCEKNHMIIRILHQYHNNMYDTVKALEKIARVEFLSYRTSKLTPGITAQQSSVFGKKFKMYVPWHLWSMLSYDTNVLVLKHLNDPINFFPYLFAWVKGIRCVVIVQRPTALSFPGYIFLQSLLIKFLQHIDARIMAVTKDGYTWAQSLHLKTSYIPTCIDPQRFKVSHLNTNPNQLHLLTVSKYQDRKHLPLLIQAVAELQQRYPAISFSLSIVGSLSQRKPSQDEYLHVQDEIKRSGLEKKILLKTNIPYSEMPTEYANAHAFILPAEREPLGYAIVEAMAAGLPVFCSTDVGAVSYVQEGENGYVFAPNSYQEIVRAIGHCITPEGITNTQLLTQLGRRSTKIIDAQHSPEKLKSSFLNLLQ